MRPGLRPESRQASAAREALRMESRQGSGASAIPLREDNRCRAGLLFHFACTKLRRTPERATGAAHCCCSTPHGLSCAGC
jgi:hypothetical protein